MRGLGIIVLVPLLAFALQPNRIKTTIAFHGEPMVALKTVQNGFNTVGYKLDVHTFTVQNRHGEITGEAVGLRAFNLAAFSENLADEGVEAVNDGSTKGVLKLSVNAQKGVWNVPMIGSEEGIQLERTQTPQWFRIETPQVIHIEAPYVGQWYPDVAILDGAMNVLYSFRSVSPQESYKLMLPEGAYYLKVSNLWGMKALREGMWIESKSPER